MRGKQPRPYTVVYSAKTWMKNEQEAMPTRHGDGDWNFLAGFLCGAIVIAVGFTLKLVFMAIG